MAKSITVLELKQMRQAHTYHQLIDIREPWERKVASIGGELIPMSLLPLSLHKVKKDIPVILYCHHGSRSLLMANTLEQDYGYTNVYTLDGGIDAYSKEIDSSIPLY